MCNKIINLEFTNNNLVDELWNILSCFPSSESSSLPASASNQLEWSGLNFLTSSCNSNDTAFSEASVSSLKSSSHDCDIACAVISEVNTPLLFRKKPILGVTVHGIVAFICTKAFSDIKFLWVNIKTVYLSSALEFGSLNNSETNCSKTPNSNSSARLDDRVDHGSSPASADTTSKDAAFIHVSSWVDFCS